MVVENSPNFLDLVQPSKEIIIVIDMMPIKKEQTPKALGIFKSLLSTLKGKPSVVIIKIFDIAKTDTKKAPVDIIENRKIFMLILSESSFSNNNIKTVRENPHNKALSKLCLACKFVHVFK